MDGNLNQDGALDTTGNQTDAPATEQTKGLQDFLTSLFKQKETASTDATKAVEKDKTSSGAASVGLSQDDVAASIEVAKKQWFAELEEKERKKNLPPDIAAAEEKETTEKEITNLRQQLLERDLRAKASTELDKLGYPVGLAELIKYDNEETMVKSLATIQETFKASLEAAIKQRLKGKTPEGLGGTGNMQNDLRDQIAKGLRG